jgi:hypothetical protein
MKYNTAIDDLALGEDPMQRRLLIFLIGLSIVLPGLVYAADSALEDTVIKSFEPIVERMTAFFRSNPKLLTKVSPPETPKIMAYSITHFQMNKLSYNIFTSSSIITPYIGHIDVDTEIADNKPCGNQDFRRLEKEGWSNIDEAIKNADNASCFVIRTPQTGVIRHRFMFQYYIKIGKWALSEIVYQDGSFNGRFMTLLGVPSPWFPLMDEPQALLYNKDWIQLLKGL